MRRAGGLALALAACAEPLPCVSVSDAPPAEPTGNVVLVVLDDLGVDKLASYGVHDTPAPTPRLDALAAQSLRFTSAYAQSTCWPARGALLTGRLPSTTGFGGPFGAREADLSYAEVLIPEALDLGSGGAWSSAAIGKWHLNHKVPAEADAPLRQGFDHFDGLLANPTEALDTETALPGRGYFRWERDVDGVLSWSQEYLTTAQADAAIRATQTLPEPYFLYVGFSAAHHPLHVPPADLFQTAQPDDDAGLADAMIEALDTELGRLVDALDPDDTLLVVADNGTAGDLVRPPSDPDRSKGTPYTGGLHVPLLARGPAFAPGVSDVLVHLTDLFPTVLDLAGIRASELGLGLDGASLLPVLRGEAPPRKCVIAEHFTPNGFAGKRRGALAVLGETHALVRPREGGEELYLRDPFAPVEGPDLLADGPLDPAAREALGQLRRWAAPHH